MAPNGFRKPPKSIIFAQYQYKLSKHGDQERCLNKYEIMMKDYAKRRYAETKEVFALYMLQFKNSAGRELR